MRVGRFIGAVLTVAAVCVAGAVLVTHGGNGRNGLQPEGAAPRPAFESTPAVEATFLRDSYLPGARASFVLWKGEKAFSIQIFRVGKRMRTRDNITMRGVRMSSAVRYGPTRAHRPIRVKLGDWPSGLYFARLEAGKRVGFAPFVIRPRRLGVHRVLLVLPTFTWQAYNFRDDDDDGLGDTWYADTSRETVLLARPFVARGVPPHFRHYDLPFLNWLFFTGKQVDVFSDSDLASVASSKDLADAYELIVFPGHHEYVTERQFDMVEQYRNRGGHLMFLSANNFFYRVIRSGNSLTRSGRWRDLGRPEAALIGVQFIMNDGGARQGPWVVTNTRRHPWLFGDTKLAVGDTFGHGGIEIDHTNESTPAGTTVVAAMPNLMGEGRTAQMTYYEHEKTGAMVFAAGAFTLGGARNPVSCHILQHLWDHMTSGRSEASCRETASSCRCPPIG